MSRRLPIAGQQVSATAGNALLVSTVCVDGSPAIAVVGARAGVGADVFVTQLSAAVERTGRSFRVERADDALPDTRLLVIIGSHVPRPMRDPAVSSLWERADLLIAEPSEIVARALVAAV